MKLTVSDLSFSYENTPILQDVSFQADPMVTAVIGPNAAGKSTLLKCIAGLLKHRGRVALDEREMDGEVARKVSYLPQEIGSPAALTVLEAVLLGRHSSLSWRVSEEDLGLAFGVLEDLGLESLASRPINQLSGGQNQMVAIAQSLVKGPEVLLMDEPTSSLDLRRQLEIFDLVREVTVEREIITLVALHDLNLAARYADSVIVLNKGRVHVAGGPRETLNSEMISSVYGVRSEVYTDDEGLPVVVPKGSAKRRRNKR